MALLNPPDILPEAMRYLVRALLALRQPQIDRDELIALVAPPGLTEAMDSLAADAADTSEAEPDDLRTGGSIIAESSLDALRSLGLVCAGRQSDHVERGSRGPVEEAIRCHRTRDVPAAP